MSKRSIRRKLGMLRAEFHSAPWSIDVRAMGVLSSALEAGDLEMVKATLALGSDSCESIAKIINGIAVIPVTGVLCDEVNFMVRWGYASSYQQIERDFKAAIGNSLVKGVLFYFDTPGGSAIGCKRVADIIFEARGSKPIRAFTQKMCGSAGFYMMAACDRAEATADALVGSIGTIYTHIEISKLLKDIGYSAEVITNSGSPKKGHGNMYEPLSDAARKTLQQYVESYGQPFINDVARYRGISAEKVLKNYGQGDAIRADVAVGQGIIDGIVANVEESLEAITIAAGNGPSAKPNTPGVSGETVGSDVSAVATNSGTAAIESGKSAKGISTMNKRLKAQLFAMGLIESIDASDEVCKVALAAYFAGRNQKQPVDDAKCLAALQSKGKLHASDEEEEDPDDSDEDDTDMEEDDEDDKKSKDKGKSKGGRKAPVDEQAEARLEDLRAAADLINATVGRKAITAEMVLEAATQKLKPRKAMNAWKKVLAEEEEPIQADRVGVKGEGADRFTKDAIDALVHRAGNNIKMSDSALALTNRPLWAVAHQCLALSGRKDVDAYGNREDIAQQAMAMGVPGQRHTFYSSKENPKYISASASPVMRPGDFPNLLSGFINKYMDTIELDEDYSYPEVSAVLPGGLNDFKPGLLINKGIVEELDEVQDAEAIKDLGISEEVLSYIFMRRFANKVGLTPVMVANDDLNAFAENMMGLDEGWQVTQNRLVVERYTANETLLDGSALFADRANTGSGTNPALNNNDMGSGGVPSDTTWGAMEAQYADIGGIATGRRVRGTLNTWFGPTGIPMQEATRTFATLNVVGEAKVAATTANVGLFRGQVKLIPESELRPSSLLKWYGLRSPTKLNTATVIRGYFNGFGEAGRRERWYDPETKTTWTSIEGRIAAAVKNWRFVVRNPGV